MEVSVTVDVESAFSLLECFLTFFSSSLAPMKGNTTHPQNYLKISFATLSSWWLCYVAKYLTSSRWGNWGFPSNTREFGYLRDPGILWESSREEKKKKRIVLVFCFIVLLVCNSCLLSIYHVVSAQQYLRALHGSLHSTFLIGPWQWLSGGGGALCPQETWQCLGSVLVFKTGVGGWRMHYWDLADRGQECHSTSDNTQDSPNIWPQTSIVPRLRTLLCKTAAAAAAKSLQSCPTLCDTIDGSPPGSSIPRILQARILEWVAISFSNAWKWKVKVKSFSHVRLFTTPWTAAYQAPLPMGFSRQEYWSGLPLPSPVR